MSDFCPILQEATTYLEQTPDLELVDLHEDLVEDFLLEAQKSHTVQRRMTNYSSTMERADLELLGVIRQCQQSLVGQVTDLKDQ
jgi:hypothetical protein